MLMKHQAEVTGEALDIGEINTQFQVLTTGRGCILVHHAKECICAGDRLFVQELKTAYTRSHCCLPFSVDWLFVHNATLHSRYDTSEHKFRITATCELVPWCFSGIF